MDQKQLRSALGRFATGVTLVTANPPGYKPFALTANSFASVSLDPPLVLWSLQKTSDTLEAFTAASHYAVNILSDQQQDLSNQYARKDQHELEAGHFNLGKTGCPVIERALAVFECRITARYDEGDHIILIGEVLELQIAPDGRPLIFHQGAYGELR